MSIIAEVMKTVTLSLQRPKGRGLDLRVSASADERGVRIWPPRGTASHLSVVVGEGDVVPFAVFENDKPISMSSLHLINGRVESGGLRILPVIGFTTESVVQRVRIVPALFSRKES